MYRGFNLELAKGDFTLLSNTERNKIAKILLTNFTPNNFPKIRVQKPAFDNTEFSKKFGDQFKNRKKRAPVKDLIHKGLDKYLSTAEIMDGTKIQEDWFPTVKAQVFISHSHQDENLAVELADWLWYHFQIDSFIDSYAWGYANDLLKIIDNTYCLNGKENGYKYELRNYSTSHVHMMLATALTKMIDKTECLLFLNTRNSVPSDEIKAQTYSPWIYHEIATTKIIRETQPIRPGIIKEGEELKKTLKETFLKFSYDLDLKHLATLNLNTLTNWSGRKYDSPEDALDRLYEITPHNSKPQKGII
jgi:hypothetical protein